MKLLVTGGAGFIGSNFIHYWLKKYPKDQIINLDKLTYAGNIHSLDDLKDNPNYSFIQADICDPQAVAKAMTGVDIVVHFAAESHVDRSILEPALFIKTNILGTQILLDAALDAKVKKFHHISTDEVFGALSLEDKNNFNENTPYAPRSPYSASKAASDHLVRAYGITYNLPINITNCSNNFGPFHFPEKIIPLFITNLIEGKKVPIYGDGKYVRDWLFVEDHCQAIDLVINKGQVGETYCVGGGGELTNLELAQKILAKFGKTDREIEYVEDRPGHDRRYAIDSSKIKNELGWAPEHDFEQALDLTIDWYKTHESWWKPLKEKQEVVEFNEQNYHPPVMGNLN